MIQPSLASATWMTQQTSSSLEMGGSKLLAAKQPSEPDKLREAFNDFVGQTFYSQMLGAMRKTVDKPAYFHGGRAEEIFQAQLDQTLSEKLSDVTADQFTGPMFELFNMKRT